MASRNELKDPYAVDALFHVYNRGVDRGLIFRNRADCREFLDCFRRHLSSDPIRDRAYRPYRKLGDSAGVVAYCLMPNHYHLIVHQKRPHGLASLMRSATIGYAKYFNQRYTRDGPLFRGRYKAADLRDPVYAKQAIAYVHLNHSEGESFEFSSHEIFTGERTTDWLEPETGLALFGGLPPYLTYLSNYKSQRAARENEPLA